MNAVGTNVLIYRLDGHLYCAHELREIAYCVVAETGEVVVCLRAN